MSEKTNTFLSQVFGSDSAYPGNDPEMKGALSNLTSDSGTNNWLKSSTSTIQSANEDDDTQEGTSEQQEQDSSSLRPDRRRNGTQELMNDTNNSSHSAFIPQRADINTHIVSDDDEDDDDIVGMHVTPLTDVPEAPAIVTSDSSTSQSINPLYGVPGAHRSLETRSPSQPHTAVPSRFHSSSAMLQSTMEDSGVESFAASGKPSYDTHSRLATETNPYSSRLNELEEEEEDIQSLMVERPSRIQESQPLMAQFNNSKHQRARKAGLDSTGRPAHKLRALPHIPGRSRLGERPVPSDLKREFPEMYSNSSDRARIKHMQNGYEEERRQRATYGILDPVELAKWKWANVDNLDLFLHDTYKFYTENGFWCSILARVLEIATLVFVVWFSSYLFFCIDFKLVKSSTSLSEVRVERCLARIPFLWKLVLAVFTVFTGLRIVEFVFEIKKLTEISNFYQHLLHISDKEIQSVSWQTVVQRIMLLKDQNAATADISDLRSKIRLDPQDIANRIMRKDNFLIAMFNKNVLDLSVKLPVYIPGLNIGGPASSDFSDTKHLPFFTKSLEWNIDMCILSFVFTQDGQINPVFLKESQRNTLAKELHRRIVHIAVLNILVAPFLVLYFLALNFFQHFNEYHKNPATFGSRQYTPLAEWKFREFNELRHLFEKRLNKSTKAATEYIDQFPKKKTVMILKFIRFLSGAFAAVLSLLSLSDPDVFLGFEISKDRTVFFYIGVFGSIWAITRGMIPEDTAVFDPEASLRTVARYTHYLPQEWEGRMHTEEVKRDFSRFYDLKLMVMLRELASLVLVPFILYFSLAESAPRIIDFFREFTVHVDGLGYVCTFAMFDFEKSKRRSDQLRDPYYASSEGKMLKSYLHFVDSYGPTAGAGAGPGIVDRSMLGADSELRYEAGTESLGSSVILKENRRSGAAVKAARVSGNRMSKDIKDSDYLTGSVMQSFQVPFSRQTEESGGHELTTSEFNKGGVLGLLNQFTRRHDLRSR